MSMVRFLVIAFLLGAAPAVAQEGKPVKTGGFNLVGRLLRQPYYTIYQANRDQCGITANTVGQVPTDVFFMCLWPKGTGNGYLFAAGLRIAGLIGPEVGAWAGDTSGAFFYDTKGTTEHAEDLTGVWSSDSASERARWPETALVPTGAAGSIYTQDLQGKIAASESDVWSMMGETNLNLLAGRVHPLGVAVETRVLGWNHPRGNEDILYLNYTIHNISATNPATYATERPAIRATLLDLARRYHQDVSDKYGITLPEDGYTIERYFTNIIADPDVGNAYNNYASTNLPLSLGFAFQGTMTPDPVYRYGPTDHGPPFFSSIGFFGMKVLGAPVGGNAIRLFTSTGFGAFGGVGEARDVVQLYRELDGTLSPSLGDPACNTGNPVLTHICYINNTAGLDIKESMSSDGGNLQPGQSANYSIALIFAAPYGVCAAPCNNLKPGDVRRITDPVMVAAAVNQIDSLTGFTGFTDLNGDGLVQGGEIRANTRSLLGKAQMAQAIFDGHFLTATAPAAPGFYLIPGDNRVSILWQPSITETAGDPYFALASSPTRVNQQGQTEINPLYDPNYRQFDVEGYRVYRGRTDDPGSMTLLAQFDYAGTTMSDYTGRVNPTSTCAPELGLKTGCPVAFDSLIPGQSLTVKREVPLDGPIIQVRDGDRIALPGGAVSILHADTAGSFTGPFCICDTGVPFQLVDSTARNNFDYFYAVTAFDVNSAQSAAGSMESIRQLKKARPAQAGSNVVSKLNYSISLEGRGRVLDTALPSPTWDGATGRFSGPFQPANFFTATFVNLLRELLNGSTVTRIHLDSLDLGQASFGFGFTNSREDIPTVFHFTVTTSSDTTRFAIPIQQPNNNVPGFVPPRAGVFTVDRTDATLASRYGGQSGPVMLDLRIGLQPVAYSGDWGVQSLFTGFDPGRNGIRWFDGPSPERNETADNPTAGNCFNCGGQLGFNNAGSLSGVRTVYQPLSYVMFDRSWRNMGASQAGARRAADYNVYWGSNGVIDSVIDMTHNVPVPFSSEAGGTWGILNASAQGNGGFDNRPGVLTPTDWSCVEPFRSRLTQPTNVWYTCTSPEPFQLSRQATLGTIAFGAGDTASTQTWSVRNPTNVAPFGGFALYLAGSISQFEMQSLPAPGTVWSMRDYVGVVYSNLTPVLNLPRPWTAVGTELVVRIDAQNYLANARASDLRKVHTVPDPFYYNTTLQEGSEGVRFVNLPAAAIVRIYSASGVLLRVIEHQPTSQSGDTFWDLRNRNGQRVASGVYFYHIESGTARRAGRMTIVNYTN